MGWTSKTDGNGMRGNGRKEIKGIEEWNNRDGEIVVPRRRRKERGEK
jgi:hypothetical protein